MPARGLVLQGGTVYHIVNRSVRGARLFNDAGDYQAVRNVLQQAQVRVPIRLLAYCLMPNHFHLVLWLAADGDLEIHALVYDDALQTLACLSRYRRDRERLPGTIQGLCNYKPSSFSDCLPVCRNECADRGSGVPRGRLALVEPLAALQKLQWASADDVANSATRALVVFG